MAQAAQQRATGLITIAMKSHVDYGHILKKDNIRLLALLLCAGMLLSGCSIGLTNQVPSPGGCTGEPSKVYC